MPCINYNDSKYYCTYNPYDISIENISPNLAMEAFKKEKFDFFYIQFSDDQTFKHFPIEQIVPQEVLQRIISKEVYLVVDNSLEFFLSCADAIYTDIVIKESIPPEQIIFLSAVPQMIDRVKKIASETNLNEIQVIRFGIFEGTGQDAIRLTEKLNFKKRSFERKFLNLNRRWRIHRPLLYTLMKDKNLTDQAYVSFAKSDDNKTWPMVYRQLKNMYSYHKKITRILDKNEDVVNTPDLYLDTQDLVTNRAMHENSIDGYYLQTMFSVVAETTYHENVVFFSEKTFKTIAMKHPFILVTSPNSLKHLREIGYKTFHPMIDESYDKIIDPGDRMIAIVNEIERICNLEGPALEEWLKSVKTVTDYNFNVLKNKKDLRIKMN